MRCDPAAIASWQRFWDVALADERLITYWGLGDPDEAIRKWKIFGTLGDIVEAYYYTNKTYNFDETLFRGIYDAWERAVFSTSLECDIVVPLIWLPCAFDVLRISEDTLVERMSEEFQLARSPVHGDSALPQDLVLGTATHALVLEGWELKEHWHDIELWKLYDIATYMQPLRGWRRSVRRCVYKLGLRSDMDRLSAPKGWVASWKASLPTVYVARTRAYPDYFENHCWLQRWGALDEATCRTLAPVYQAILERPELRVPSKRLNAAFLRRDEEDSILDVTIGLEALLVTDKGENTHKLAMRLAALCKLEPFQNYTSEHVFRICKILYDYRSDVAHGRPLDKKRVIKLEQAKPLPTVALGIALLRHVILSLSKRPEYFVPENLDKYLLSPIIPASPESGVADRLTDS